ncbi:MAG: transglutaminase N-terminal domain-containing protein [Pirellulales bacterium]
MRYNIRHTTIYSYTDPVPVCHNLVHLAPRDTPAQSCREHRVVIDPQPSVRAKRRDYFGNDLEFFSIQEAHEGLSVTAMSLVDVSSPVLKVGVKTPPWESVVAEIPANTRPPGLAVYFLTLPSPRIRASTALAEYARPSFPAGRPIFDAVRDFTARIHNDFTFDPKATTVSTPPEELLQLRRGVCQDFAHLQIACLRSLGLAARYVSGYVATNPPPGMPRLAGADASHAWVSAFCGPLGWVDFDPTNDTVVGDQHITIGWGRDYGDVCPIQGVFIGGGQHSMRVGVDVIPLPALK